MTFLFMLIGAVLGAFFCAGMFENHRLDCGACSARCVGLLFGQLRTLRARVSRSRTQARATARDGCAATAAHGHPDRRRRGRASTPQQSDTPGAAQSSAPSVRARLRARTVVAQIPSRPAAAAADRTRQAAEPSAVISPSAVATRNRRRPTMRRPRVKRWFTEGNVPVKVGVIVLFLGVAALLKYAADQGWLQRADGVPPRRHRRRRARRARVRMAQARVAPRVRAEPAGRRDRRVDPHDLRRVRLYALLPAGSPSRCSSCRRRRRDAGRAAGCDRAGRARDRRRLPRADPDLDRQRQSRRPVQLLRRAQCARCSRSPGSSRGAR